MNVVSGVISATRKGSSDAKASEGYWKFSKGRQSKRRSEMRSV